MHFCNCCCCRGKSRKHRLVAGGVTGLFLVVIGGMLLFLFNLVFDAVVKQQTTIKDGTLFYPEWVETTQRVYVNFYMFNVTNPAEFSAQIPGHFVKPILQEVGPYTYRALLIKDNIAMVDVKPQEIRYRQKYLLYFEPELSNGSEDDMITTINFIATALPPIFEYLFTLPAAENITLLQKQLVYRTINRVIGETNSELLFTHTAGGLLFGFQDPLLTEIADVLNTVLNQTGLSHLLPVPDTFGIFLLTNMSLGWKYFHAFTGNPEYELTSVISRLNNKTTVDYWFGDHCNMINGTDGTTRPPYRTKEEKIYFFVANVCRSSYAVYSREVSVKRVPGWEYIVPKEVLASPKNSEYNKCFCDESNAEEFCIHDGGLLLRTCLYGAPVLISAPHFLHGDGYYKDRISGMNPNLDEHRTVFIYEPNSGACLQADKRLQFSIYMKPNENVDLTQKIEEIFAFPIFWLNETYVVNDDDADLLHGLIVISENVFFSLQIISCIVGGLLFIYVVYSAVRMNVQESLNYHLEEEKDNKCETYMNDGYEGEKVKNRETTK